MNTSSSFSARVRFCSRLWTSELRAFALTAVEAALRRFERRVSFVNMKIEDLNGPRGGTDKRCIVEVELRGCSMVIVRSTASETEYAAIANACSRVKTNVTRTLTRPLTLPATALSPRRIRGQ